MYNHPEEHQSTTTNALAIVVLGLLGVLLYFLSVAQTPDLPRTASSNTYQSTR
jgi:hypothetical protein